MESAVQDAASGDAEQTRDDRNNNLGSVCSAVPQTGWMSHLMEPIAVQLTKLLLQLVSETHPKPLCAGRCSRRGVAGVLILAENRARCLRGC